MNSPTSPSTTRQRSAESLRGLAGGGVHLPGDAGYDVARTPWNLAVDLRPAAVAVPRSVEEVVAVVRASTAAGLRVVPQSTGHGAGPLAGRDLSDAVLVRLHELTGVTVDPGTATARVVGGTWWKHVVDAAAPHGLTALHGSAPDVAVAGYALSGGLSFYGRSHGLAANSVRAVELVTGTGELVRADADHHADLFWAVRGAGGNLGVVVAVELDLLPMPDVYAGMLLWDRERAPEVLRTWVEWTRTVPESATTSLRIMSFPPMPELPPFLSGRQLVVIDGAVLEEDDRAAELLAPLRGLAPEIDTFGRMPVTGLLDVHMDPPQPSPAVADHTVLDDVTDEALEVMLARVGPGVRTPLLFAELRHLGGAFAIPPPGGGALSRIEGRYGVYAVAIAPTPEAAAAGQAAATALVEALAPWSRPGRIPTFSDLVHDMGAAYPSADWERLLRVRDEYDPGHTFVANHALD